MKIAVVGGAGAMGGVWASRLSAAGHDVAILDVAADALAAIERDGLAIDDPEGVRRVTRLLCTDDAARLGIRDVVIFFVKSHHTRAAAALAAPAVGPETTIVTLQNGWGNADALAGIFDPERLVMGVTYHSAKVLSPGVIAHTAARPTFVGPYSEGASLERAESVAGLMNAAGIVTSVAPGITTEIWKKLIVNAAGLPLAALTRLMSGPMGANDELMHVSDGLATEAVAVARARGLDIDRDERIAVIRGLRLQGGSGKPSMLQDVEARRKTEIEVVNGAIVREGERLGVDVPLNRVMVALIHGLEASWSQ